jgi:hypothetical protein
MRIGSSRAACVAGTLPAATPGAPARALSGHQTVTHAATGHLHCALADTSAAVPGMTLAGMRPYLGNRPAGQAMDAYAEGGWAGSEGGK